MLNRDAICKTIKGEASLQNVCLLGVELIKSDVNLNLAQMCHVIRRQETFSKDRITGHFRLLMPVQHPTDYLKN